MLIPQKRSCSTYPRGMLLITLKALLAMANGYNVTLDKLGRRLWESLCGYLRTVGFEGLG